MATGVGQRCAKTALVIAIHLSLISGCGAPPPSFTDGGEARDRDGDGIEDALDNCPSTANPSQQDSDADGVGDACAFGPCAGFGGDEDADEVCQAHDNCRDVPNSDQRDSDEDEFGDLCDRTPNACDDHGDDGDDDGVCGRYDNCLEVANAGQIDQDGDGVGDACDDTPVPLPDPPCAGRGGDADEDDVCQAGDNCQDAPNPDQRDTDMDGFGDACDATPGLCDDHRGDIDGDTICGSFDNCPDVSNRNQLDRDLDGIGDVCDPTPPPDDGVVCRGAGGDLDGDGWCGVDDNCPNDGNPRQEDADRDGVGDECDPEICDGGDDDGDGLIDEGFGDADGDMVADCIDTCPSAIDRDSDFDRLLDCVDACPMDPLNDVDGDRTCGDVDNCPAVANATQADTDADGIGDACDVEVCDGIDNDGDRTIDDGLPDDDGDGVCNSRDRCPMDTLNDDDDDGHCWMVDNCPRVGNSGQEDADADGAGDACDLDFVCDPPVTVSAPGAVPLPTGLTISDIVADPVRPIVYAAVRPTSPAYGNSIVAIDPPTRSVLWSMVVGSDPALVTVSDDGSRLYVALNGANVVRMVAPGTRRACRSFPLGSGSFGARYAGDFGVLPGEPGTLLVSTRRRGVSPSFDGVFVFDEGQARPDSTPDHTGATRVEVASSTIAYGFNDSSTEFGFRRLVIDARGVREDWVQRSFFSGFGNDILYAGDRVFTRTGEVIDPSMPAIVGTLSSPGPIAVAPEIQRAFTSTSGGIAVSDLTSYLRLRTVSYPPGVSGTPRIIRWGSDGLALLAGDGVTFLGGVVVP